MILKSLVMLNWIFLLIGVLTGTQKTKAMMRSEKIKLLKDLQKGIIYREELIAPKQDCNFSRGG